MANAGDVLERAPRAGLHRLVPILVLLPLVFGLLLWQVRALVIASERVDHSDQVLSQLHALEKLALELETGMRGYALTRQRTFLAPYEGARASVGGAVDRLERLVQDAPQQQRDIAQLRAELAQWLTFAEQLIARKERGEDVAPVIALGYGKARLDAMRLVLGRMVQGEEQLRAARATSARTWARRTSLLAGAAFLGLAVPLVLLLAQRRRWERSLMLSEQRVRALSDQVKEYAIVLLGPDGSIQSWGAGAERLHGFRAEEVLGRPFSLLFTPEDAERGAPAQELDQARTQGQFQSEGWRVRKDGSRFWTEVVTTRLQDADGHVFGYAKVARDLTDRRQAEQALRESEERFRTALDEAPIGMALVGLDGRFLRVNHALCAIVGYTPEELTRLTFQAITHPDDLEVDLGRVRQLERGELQRYQLDKRYLHKSGRVVDVLLTGSAVRDRDGAPLYFIAQVQDITERKRAEAEQRLLLGVQAALASSLDYHASLDRTLALITRELADCCCVELAFGERRVRRVELAGHDAAAARLAEALQAVAPGHGSPGWTSGPLETGRPLLVEHVTPEHLDALARGEEHRRLLDELAPASFMALPLVARGSVFGALGLVRGRSSPPFEARDLRLAADVAARMAAAMENAHLYDAAQQAVAARDDVLGVVAHDLRNPLNNIVMQVQVLLRNGDTPERRARSADKIRQSATRMNRIIQDLLDVARADAGHLAIAQTRLSPLDVLAAAVESQQPLATREALELRSEVTTELPDVWADRDRVLQVLENLIGNAIKFTGEGGTVTVGAAPRDGDVLFWVADTGRGIPADDVPHLFDRFWQAGKRDRRGAGLGLSIVKTIVEAHGGRIWVESAPGLGARFFFTLPAFASHAQHAGAMTLH